MNKLKDELDPENQHPLILLAKNLSSNDSEVVADVSLYCLSPQKYFDNIDEDIRECCSIESPNDIRPAQVLVTALHKNAHLVIADNRSEPIEVLSSLNKLSKGGLEKSNLYLALEEFFAKAPYGFGSYLNGVTHSPTTFDCAKSVGLQLLAIDDDSDAILLFFCRESEKEKIVSLSKEAKINLYSK